MISDWTNKLCKIVYFVINNYLDIIQVGHFIVVHFSCSSGSNSLLHSPFHLQYIRKVRMTSHRAIIIFLSLSLRMLPAHSINAQKSLFIQLSSGKPAVPFMQMNAQSEVAETYCRVQARWGLQQTHPGLRAESRQGVRDPLVRSLVD